MAFWLLPNLSNVDPVGLGSASNGRGLIKRAIKCHVIIC